MVIDFSTDSIDLRDLLEPPAPDLGVDLMLGDDFFFIFRDVVRDDDGLLVHTLFFFTGDFDPFVALHTDEDFAIIISG